MAASPRRRAGSRLLFVEQDPHMIDTLRDLFTQRAFECEVALSIETAEAILAERRMNMVVVDATTDPLPRGGIPSLIQRLRAADGEMRIVVFNGVGRKATQRRMRRLGADGYLSKKSDLNAVARSVYRIMDGEA